MESATILIVEDDLFLRELYQDILSSEPWNVQMAADGQEGLHKIEEGGWDLILLDMNLPKMSGLEIVKRLGSQTINTNNKRLVFLTNMEEGPEIKEVQKLGYEYVIKSEVVPDQFLQQIKKYLAA